MDDCWTIVPVKDVDEAKSRLRAALPPDDKVSLCLEMLGRASERCPTCTLEGLPSLQCQRFRKRTPDVR